MPHNRQKQSKTITKPYNNMNSKELANKLSQTSDSELNNRLSMLTNMLASIQSTGNQWYVLAIRLQCKLIERELELRNKELDL